MPSSQTSEKIPGKRKFLTRSTVTFTPTIARGNATLSCFISSEKSDVTSSDVSLVLYHPPFVKVHQESELKEGHEATFLCEVVAWPPVRRIYWGLEGEKIPGETNSALTLKLLSRDQHETTVGCSVENGEGLKEENILVLNESLW